MPERKKPEQDPKEWTDTTDDDISSDWAERQRRIEEESQSAAEMAARYAGEAAGFLRLTSILSKEASREAHALHDKIEEMEESCKRRMQYMPKGFLPLWALDKTTEIIQERPMACVGLVVVLLLLIMLLLLAVVVLTALGWDLGTWLDQRLLSSAAGFVSSWASF